MVSLFRTFQVFGTGCDFTVVSGGLSACPQGLAVPYLVWAAALFVIAPLFSFGFLLSLFHNISSYLKYMRSYFKAVYVFSELNERSLALASDIKKNNRKAAIAFAGVTKQAQEKLSELIESAGKIGAICFEKDILTVNFRKHHSKSPIYFFTIGMDENENLAQTLKLIEGYKDRPKTHIYLFSTAISGEMALCSADKGELKVRRVNDVQALINRILYERGELFFDHIQESPDGKKHICAVIVGLGKYGTAMLKALAWYCQMDGYKLEIHAFDRDPLAEEKLTAQVPELMSPEYNGIEVEGEAQYRIVVHSGIDVETATFAREMMKLTETTYVLVALGDDDLNIRTASNLRMYFERMKIDPAIQSIVHQSELKKVLTGLKNFKGQSYRIEFIGDLESLYTQHVMIDSELEDQALRPHKKKGQTDAFWAYQYHYCSSIAAAIHRKVRKQCGIPGSDKKAEDLTDEERAVIEPLEHRRWNAYMRSQGYIYSRSKDPASRNDLGKMHHDLVEFSSLTEEEKRKDSQVGNA